MLFIPPTDAQAPLDQLFHLSPSLHLLGPRPIELLTRRSSVGVQWLTCRGRLFTQAPRLKPRSLEWREQRDLHSFGLVVSHRLYQVSSNVTHLWMPVRNFALTREAVKFQFLSSQVSPQRCRDARRPGCRRSTIDRLTIPARALLEARETCILHSRFRY